MGAAELDHSAHVEELTTGLGAAELVHDCHTVVELAAGLVEVVHDCQAVVEVAAGLVEVVHDCHSEVVEGVVVALADELVVALADELVVHDCHSEVVDLLLVALTGVEEEVQADHDEEEAAVVEAVVVAEADSVQDSQDELATAVEANKAKVAEYFMLMR